MTSSLLLEAILSSFNWSEKSGAGHIQRFQNLFSDSDKKSRSRGKSPEALGTSRPEAIQSAGRATAQLSAQKRCLQ
jgi:hypothetical protein